MGMLCTAPVPDAVTSRLDWGAAAPSRAGTASRWSNAGRSHMGQVGPLGEQASSEAPSARQVSPADRRDNRVPFISLAPRGVDLTTVCPDRPLAGQAT